MARVMARDWGGVVVPAVRLRASKRVSMCVHKGVRSKSLRVRAKASVDRFLRSTTASARSLASRNLFREGAENLERVLREALARQDRVQGRVRFPCTFPDEDREA